MSSSTTTANAASDPAFALRKHQILNGVDLSPKGSIDTPILPLVNLLNSHDSVCTTSCCSGRISVFQDGELSSTSKGGGGRWVLVSHDPVDVEEALETVWQEFSDPEGLSSEKASLDGGHRFVHLKFEPMVIHLIHQLRVLKG